MKISQSVVIRVIFFLTAAAAASWLSFFNLFLKNHIGLSDGQIGVVIAIQQVNTLLILPFWGMIADRFGRKNMLTLTMFIAVFMLWGFLLQKTFLAIILFVYIFTLFNNPVFPLLDSVALDFLEQEKKQSYGELRLWASVGWALSSAITGLFISANNSYMIFIIASCLLAMSFMVLHFFYKPLKVTRSLKTLKFNAVRQVFMLDPRLTTIFIIMFFYGVFSSPVHLFINIYYMEIGAGYHHVGYAFLFQAMAEVPFFIFGKRIIDRFGARRLIVFTMIVTSFRLLAYGFISNPWFAILLGTTHGISLALFFLAFIAFVHQFIPAEYRATGQSLIYAIYFGGGLALGNIITGVVSEFVGMQKTMMIQGGMSMVLVIVTLFLLGAWGKIKKASLAKYQKR
jgi:PPP family 3-phenylpropionic acid transporter